MSTAAPHTPAVELYGQTTNNLLYLIVRGVVDTFGETKKLNRTDVTNMVIERINRRLSELQHTAG